MPYRPDQDQRTWSEIVRPAIRIVSLDGREIFILLVYTIALGLVAAAVPLASQILVNQAAFTGAAPPILALSVIVLGVLLVGTFIRLFQIRVAALIAKRTFVRSAIEGTRALLDSPSQAYEFDDREVANRFFDVMTFQVAFSVLASEVLGVLVVSLVGIAILAFYHPLFFSFSIVVALTCMLIIGFSAKQGVKRGTRRSSEKYRVAFWLSQIAENRSMLRQSDNNRIVHSMTDELSTEYVRSYFDYLRVLLWQSGALFLIQAFASAAFFGVGGWLVINGQLSLGQLVAAEIIVLSNMAALTRFYFYLDSFYETVVAASKISQLTEANAGDPTRVAASKSAKITRTYSELWNVVGTPRTQERRRYSLAWTFAPELQCLPSADRSFRSFRRCYAQMEQRRFDQPRKRARPSSVFGPPCCPTHDAGRKFVPVERCGYAKCCSIHCSRQPTAASVRTDRC